jgi:hypothetical protein
VREHPYTENYIELLGRLECRNVPALEMHSVNHRRWNMLDRKFEHTF